MTTPPDPLKYHIIFWDTGEIYRSFERLGIAKKYARGLGHNGIDDPFLTGYAPIAYVGNDKKEVIYNPRFGKRIGGDVSGLVNSNDDCLRG